MKKILSKTALSLIELIIASILVVIVVLGIFAINSVLSNNNQDYGQRYLVKSETQTTLNHILNDASMAIGSGTTDSNNNFDQGIILPGNVPGDSNTFCIHQDINSLSPDYTTSNNPPTSPPNYLSATQNSRWLCYSWSPSTYQINYCTMQFNYNIVLGRGASGPCPAGSTYLGTAFSIKNPPPTFNSTSGFSITIQNCLNNSGTITINGVVTPSCFSSTPDPANNPEVQLSGSVFPSQEGMQQN